MRTRLVVAVGPDARRSGGPCLRPVAARPRARRHGRVPERDSPRRSAPRRSATAARRSTRPSPRRSRSPSRTRPPATSAAAGSSSSGRLPARREAYDFREMAPAKATPTMFLKDGKYSSDLHHNSYLSVGVPGTVAGLHLAWKEHGKLPWKRLVEPAIALARDGFAVTEGLSRSLRSALKSMAPYPASIAQFSKNGAPYEAGRHPEAARPGADAPADRRPGARRVLRGRDGRAHREGHGGARRPDHARGPEGVPAEEAHAAHRHLPRLRHHLDAADQLGRRRPHRAAEHPRGLRPEGARIPVGGEHAR